MWIVTHKVNSGPPTSEDFLSTKDALKEVERLVWCYGTQVTVSIRWEY